MAGIINKTARQYNLKCIAKSGHRVVVRVAPGFNVVEDEHWIHLKNDPYVKSLKKDGLIDFGSKVDDMVLEKDPDTKSKSKMTAPPQDKSKEEAKAKAEEEAKVKAEAEAKVKAEMEAKAKAEEEAKVKAEAEAKVKAGSKGTKPEDDDL